MTTGESANPKVLAHFLLIVSICGQVFLKKIYKATSYSTHPSLKTDVYLPCTHTYACGKVNTAAASAISIVLPAEFFLFRLFVLACCFPPCHLRRKVTTPRHMYAVDLADVRRTTEHVNKLCMHRAQTCRYTPPLPSPRPLSDRRRSNMTLMESVTAAESTSRLLN